MAHKDWYVALVDADTPFDPVEHRRRDLPVKRVNLSGSEDGEVDRLGLVCVRRTDAPTLAPGAPRWVHLSRELADGGLRHMGYGYVIPTPAREDDEVETFEFNLSPFDWAGAKLGAAQALKVYPYYDEVTVAPEARNDVSEILDGYSCVPHCHRSTHAATFPEITGAGLPVLEAPAPWMPGPKVTTLWTPIAGVDVDSSAEWTQSAEDILDTSEAIRDSFDLKQVSTLTPDEFERSWLRPGSDVNGDSGWTVIDASLRRKLDLPSPEYPRTAGPFRGPSSTYNYVQDRDVKNPVSMNTGMDRVYYDAKLTLAWTLRQKRIERIRFRVVNGGQAWALGEWKSLSVRLEDVSRDDRTPYWKPGAVHVAGNLYRVGALVYSCLSTHQATFSFAQDVLGTGPEGGIVQRWALAQGDQSPLGHRGAGTYWLQQRGEVTLQNLALKARAMILHSQRCVEIRFRHLLTDALLDITTAHRVTLRAPADMLRGGDGGVVTAKVYGYEIVSDQDDEYVEVTLRACVGSGLAFVGGNGLVTQTGEAWDRILYLGYAAQQPEVLPPIQCGVAVKNDVPEQTLYVQARDFNPLAGRKDNSANDPKNIIRTVPTELVLYLTQISGRPDMAHDIEVPVPAPFAGPRQWSVTA